LKIKSQQDFWAGVLFIVIGVAFAWGATFYRFGSTAMPGPGYFPLGLGVLLALLGAVILFVSLTFETEGGDPIGAIAWRPLLVILGSVLVFGFLLPELGLIVLLPVLVVAVSTASTEFDFKQSAIAAVLLTALCWSVFIKGLSLPIPMLPDATALSTLPTRTMTSISKLFASEGN
jgi:hypothetical protein